MSEQRFQLIERLCRLPESQLVIVEALLANLERNPGDAVLPTTFERTATPAQWKTIASFKTDRLKIDDDYRPVV